MLLTLLFASTVALAADTPAAQNHLVGYDTIKLAFNAAQAPTVEQVAGATSGRCYLFKYPTQAAAALLTVAEQYVRPRPDDGDGDEPAVKQLRMGIWGAYVLSGGEPDEAYYDHVAPDHVQGRIDDMFNGHGGDVKEAWLSALQLCGGVRNKVQFDVRWSGNEALAMIRALPIKGHEGDPPYAYCTFFNKR